jgi:hypothetical protein
MPIRVNWPRIRNRNSTGHRVILIHKYIVSTAKHCYMNNIWILYHFDQFTVGLEILKIYEPRSGIRCEKQGQTLFFDPLCDVWLANRMKWYSNCSYSLVSYMKLGAQGLMTPWAPSAFLGISTLLACCPPFTISRNASPAICVMLGITLIYRLVCRISPWTPDNYRFHQLVYIYRIVFVKGSRGRQFFFGHHPTKNFLPFWAFPVANKSTNELKFENLLHRHS